MLEKNLAAIEKKNPKLAQELRDYKKEAENIEVYEAESKDIILSYQGILLHSNEDPIRESKSIWHKTVAEELGEKDIQIVYGLGIGYLFKRAYINAQSRVFVYEPSIEILKFVLENVDFHKELDDDRVYISNDKNDFIQHFEQKYLSGDKVEVLFLPSYLHFGKENLLKLSEEIYEIVKNKGIDQKTIAVNTQQAVKNLIKRYKRLKHYAPIDAFKDKFKDKSGLILAIGPSLQDNIEKIKQNKDKFITIAILPAIDILTKHGIEPDFLLAVDPWNQVHKYKNSIRKLENTNLIVDARADISLDELNTNSKIVYFSNIDKISGHILTNVKDVKVNNSTASVVLLAYEVAKIMGLKDVTFTGLDLAILDNKIYADNDNITIENGTKLLIENELGTQIRYVTKVKSANGKEVITREDYLLFIKEFEKLAKEYDALKMYNTSLNGAYIEGMEYRGLEATTSELESIDININEVVSNTAKDNKCVELQSVCENYIKNQKTIIEKGLPNIDTVIEATDKLLKVLKEEKPDLEKFQKIFNKHLDNFTEARALITKDILMSTYMQGDIMEYLKSYNRDKDIDVKKLISNFECDNTLFKNTKAAASDIITIM